MNEKTNSCHARVSGCCRLEVQPQIHTDSHWFFHFYIDLIQQIEYLSVNIRENQRQKKLQHSPSRE